MVTEHTTRPAIWFHTDARANNVCAQIIMSKGYNPFFSARKCWQSASLFLQQVLQLFQCFFGVKKQRSTHSFKIESRHLRTQREKSQLGGPREIAADMKLMVANKFVQHALAGCQISYQRTLSEYQTRRKHTSSIPGRDLSSQNSHHATMQINQPNCSHQGCQCNQRHEMVLLHHPNIMPIRWLNMLKLC